MWTNEEVAELLQAIQNQHLLFIAENVDVAVLSPNERQSLSGEMQSEAYLDDMFKFGLLSALSKNPEVKKMTFNEFKNFLRSGNFVDLSDEELYGLQALKWQAYSSIKGLGNKIQSDLTVLIEADRRQRLKTEIAIQDEVEQGKALRKTVPQIVSALGEKTSDWSRDFGRIADFLMHNAFDQGRAFAYVRDFGPDVEVYKDVYEGACKHCIRLYLTNGIGSEPIVFKLKQIIGNSNIGVKAEDWKPVVGATHPFCRCYLSRKQFKMDWDQENRGFVKPALNDSLKVTRQSKVRVTVGDKTTII